jgi:hypothetical protein
MSVSILSRDEIVTLQAIANPANTFAPPRLHLEKLSRLDLIEPCGTGVRLSIRGQAILINNK